MDLFVRAAVALILLVGGEVDAQAQPMHPRYSPPQQLQGPAYPQAGPEVGVYPERVYGPPDGAFNPPPQAGQTGFYDAPMPMPSAPEPYAMSQDAYHTPKIVKPKLYGVKTTVLALLVLLSLIYFSIFIDDSNLILEKKLLDPSVPPSEKMKSLGIHAIMPFPTIDRAESLVYYSFLVVLVSGLTEVFSSFKRRAKARKGEPVRLNPPMRAVTMMHVGLLLVIISLAGVLLGIHPLFLGLSHLAEAIVVATFALFLISALQKLIHKNPSTN